MSEIFQETLLLLWPFLESAERRLLKAEQLLSLVEGQGQQGLLPENNSPSRASGEVPSDLPSSSTADKEENGPVSGADRPEAAKKDETISDYLALIKALKNRFLEPLDHHQQEPLQLKTTNKEAAEEMASKAHLDNALPDMVRECGYQFTSSLEACRQHLRSWAGGTGGEIHAATVARIIGVMVRTHTGLDDSAASLQNMNATGTSLWDKDNNKLNPQDPKTWNLEVFINVVHEMQHTLHWKEIIYELDHPGFLVTDRQSLILLITALKLGFQVCLSRLKEGLVVLSLKMTSSICFYDVIIMCFT